MSTYNPEVVRVIKDVYSDLTAVERSIADFFLENTELIDFSSKSIAGKLYVSEASLSRFAKKCGFKGFREFIYNYEYEFKRQHNVNIDELTSKVIATYRQLLEKSMVLVNGRQMNRIAMMLSECRRVFVYGMGSSGIAAQEFKLRFMRVGLAVEAVVDSHMIRMTSALLDSDCLVIAFSVSGTTPDLTSGLAIAKECGAKVILVTANQSLELIEQCDEVLHIAAIDDMEFGLEISPQFPILVIVDVFFSYYLNTDYYYKSAKHTDTLAALYRGYNGH